MKNWSLKIFGLAIIGLMVMSCSDSEDDKYSKLTLDLTGLEDLGNDAQYEGWIIVDGSPITTGTFKVGHNGTLSSNTFEVLSQDLDKASTFVLTIEPLPDNDPSPSDVHVLAGNFSGNESILSIGHEAALGNDFSSAQGGYILATPTDGGIDNNEESGVWFLDPSGPSATLNLPTLPAGWAYEGWAVINGVPVSTGTFLNPNGADDASIYSGDAGGPPFPGEDFLKNAPSGLSFPASLAGGAIVISIEPVPDNDPAPFTLKPLLGIVENQPSTHSVMALDNNISNTNISGVAMR